MPSMALDEVVFLNENNELTEGSITSLFIERDGVLLTPPLRPASCPVRSAPNCSTPAAPGSRV